MLIHLNKVPIKDMKIIVGRILEAFNLNSRPIHVKVNGKLNSVMRYRLNQNELFLANKRYYSTVDSDKKDRVNNK